MTTTDEENAAIGPSLLLDRAAVRVSSAVQRVLRGSGLTLERWRILDLLADREGMTMSEIASAVVVTGPTLTRIVDDLATKALVHREVDTHDRRRVLVHLTPRGRRLRESLRPAVVEAESAALSALTDAQRNTLSALLARLTDASTGR
ncbi:MAG TPA: MarR family transcriptional regulator [Pseudonocardia sp.]|uniref:MarR family winged helix-turn-helix transcriptional regulator n=1 Tax=Pseudonocardia sp. TaxID=60912 RepID=UPI002B4B7885|nr:MarR family transcriptional regulator [Pseudonocardia sp.]HLU60339.1 MarR family transcriptional regulator [Pseudonocardia sp.]